MPLKFVTVNNNVFQLLGASSPRPPTGAPPLDPAGGLPSPRPPRLCSSKISLKNPLLRLVQVYQDWSTCAKPFDVFFPANFRKYPHHPHLVWTRMLGLGTFFRRKFRFTKWTPKIRRPTLSDTAVHNTHPIGSFGTNRGHAYDSLLSIHSFSDHSRSYLATFLRFRT